MPAEKFYTSGQVEVDGREPDFTVEWGACDSPKHVGDNCHGAVIHGRMLVNPNDLSGLDRLIATLRRVKRRIEGDHRSPCVDGSVCGEPAHCPPEDTPLG